ncbi:MAG: transcriptional regulator NrdR [Candidatus Saganbacteria bacterium]|nr:transcriptional regulator NrdR [Candidatus Saganbacteria bacterium]
MKCPFCGKKNDRVLESRVAEEGLAVRRRRECVGCKERFTSYERIEEKPLWVIKRDGRKETYSREKLLSGVVRACHKRSVALSAVERLVSEVEKLLHKEKGREVKSSKLGELTLKKLRKLDSVAYVRFASVYHQFKNPEEFFIEMKKLLSGGRRGR